MSIKRISPFFRAHVPQDFVEVRGEDPEMVILTAKQLRMTLGGGDSKILICADRKKHYVVPVSNAGALGELAPSFTKHNIILVVWSYLRGLNHPPYRLQIYDGI